MRNHLKALRQDHGMTQQALADALGVSRQTVHSIESGKYEPSLPLAFKISRLLARPIEEFFIADDLGA
ncbi:MAG TPA: helix-turn-helix transcriptional regulator [Acidovorax sp.]|nr:helix-turn-helix transcriptional regulator [Acidovorax sp.]